MKDLKKYFVINTHRGLFSYNRLPFGLSSAQGIFQCTMESLLHGIPKVVVYLDDNLVTGLSEEDHLLTKWKWTEDEKQAFKLAKELLTLY